MEKLIKLAVLVGSMSVANASGFVDIEEGKVGDDSIMTSVHLVNCVGAHASIRNVRQVVPVDRDVNDEAVSNNSDLTEIPQNLHEENMGSHFINASRDFLSRYQDCVCKHIGKFVMGVFTGICMILFGQFVVYK